jgi:TonB family protein
MASVFAQHRLTYQLYSWQEIDGDHWNFSVLHDTDRQKTVGEVFTPKTVFRGLDQLKQRISEMPEGSRIVWFDRLTIGGAGVKGSERLKYPTEEVVAEVRRHAQARGIEILGPPPLQKILITGPCAKLACCKPFAVSLPADPEPGVFTSQIGFRLRVNANGTVRGVRMTKSSGYDDTDHQIVEGARRWCFERTKEGRDVDVVITLDPR